MDRDALFPPAVPQRDPGELLLRAPRRRLCAGSRHRRPDQPLLRRRRHVGGLSHHRRHRAGLGSSVPLSAVGFAVVYAVVGTSALGYVLGRTVVLPLAGKPSLAMLIATIGVAIVLEELMRIANGGRELWLRPILADTLVEFPDPVFTIRISIIQATRPRRLAGPCRRARPGRPLAPLRARLAGLLARPPHGLAARRRPAPGARRHDGRRLGLRRGERHHDRHLLRQRQLLHGHRARPEGPLRRRHRRPQFASAARSPAPSSSASSNRCGRAISRSNIATWRVSWR